MGTKYLLGIDIGTQSIRAGLFTPEGAPLAIASVDQYMNTSQPGWATQKPAIWWSSTISNIKKIVSKSGIEPKDIAGIGCCAVMHSPVAVKLDGTVLLDDVQMYCDKRANIYIEEMEQLRDDRLLPLAANTPTSNWFGLKMKWIKENQNEIYNEADKFLTPKDFINFKLTGETAIDFSEASGSYMMDANTHEWSDELISLLDNDKEKLPWIAQASDQIGTVSKKAAEETGLNEGTPVACGGGDMFCSLLTSGMTKYGTAVDLTGTGSVICLYTEKPILDSRIMNICHVLPGWVPFGCIDSSGGAFRWYRDVLAKKETEYARNSGIDEYAYLSELAEKVEYGANGIIFYPYLMGERTLGTSYARAVYLGMNAGTETGHLVRAMLEGIAFEHKRTLDIMEESAGTINAVYHTGGGAKGALWSQIKADIYEKPVYTLKASEGGLWGAALLGGTCAGFFSSLREGAEKTLEIDTEFIPDKNKADKYREVYAIYKEVHDLLQDPFKKLAKLFI